jgi:hypothetical protein|tara:strand:- start:579 stop:890 length:312 start_codon:yes stop_codon:yes gene_type:complete
MAIRNSQISSVGSQIYFSTGTNAITTIFFCNSSVVDTAEVTVYAVPNGSVVSTGTMILNSVSLPPTETFVMDNEKLILGPNDTLYAVSSVNNIVVSTISSVSI